MKKFSRALAVLCSAAMIMGMTACGSSSEPTNDTEQTKYEFNMACSNMNGSYYQWALPMCDLIGAHTNITVNAVPTGGSNENISYLEAGETELGGIPSATMWAYLNGKYDFDGAPHSGLSVFSVSYGDYYYICVPADSEINSIADMKGCRFNITSSTSSVNGITHNMFKILGYDLDTYCKTYEMTHAEATSAMQEGNIDAMAIQVGLGNSTLLELAASRCGLKIVGFTQEEAQKIQEAWPGYFVKTIPAGSYDGVDQDITTVGSYFMTVIRDDVPEDAVYEMIKAVCENNDEFAASISSAAESTAENTLTACGSGDILPLHSGCVKYFKEVGLME